MTYRRSVFSPSLFVDFYQAVALCGYRLNGKPGFSKSGQLFSGI
jgi:hypothetical protein